MHSDQLLAEARTQWELMPSRQDSQTTKEGESTTGQQNLRCFTVRRGLARSHRDEWFGSLLQMRKVLSHHCNSWAWLAPAAQWMESTEESGPSRWEWECKQRQWRRDMGSFGWLLLSDVSLQTKSSLLPAMQPQTRNGLCVFQWLREKSKKGSH